jgi:chromosome segregation ATPase
MSPLRILILLVAFIALFSLSSANPTEQELAASEPAILHEQDASLIQTSAEVEGPTGRRPTLPANKQPKDKLDVALAAIKQDIMVRNRQLEEEKNWVSEVRKVTEQYNKKVHRVSADIIKTRSEVKALFKKKKQIENLKIQRQLESKLKDATSDLSTLQQALHHVKSKASEFDKTKQEIKKTIYTIHTQLAKLKGEKPTVKAPTDL